MQIKVIYRHLHKYLRNEFANLQEGEVGIPKVDPRTHEPNPQASSVPLPHGTHGPR